MILLDSSAWLAHLFGEPGVEQVTHLFDDTDAEVNISVLSIPEIYARLKAIDREDRWPRVWDAYGTLFTKVLPVDEAVAHQAIGLRAAIPNRLPTIDGLIAATAAVHKLMLVHRDPHFAAIPAHLLSQIQLPDKQDQED
ncbi:MAG: type II toxin-antitoxin system VapC family toxin [Anaerolineales bacterium]|nr:type II toxin-antitoxin system VapC family toxin [Anaerolineales bacterium]